MSLENIKLAFDSAMDKKGSERLPAVRKVYDDLAAFELECVRHPFAHDLYEIREMKDLIGIVQAALNRLEAGEKRRQERLAEQEAK